MKMKFPVNHDISSRLYTNLNETYQQYLRRRLAQIISEYCDRLPWECGQGTLSMARYEAREAQSADHNNRSQSAEDRYPLESDEDEPSFTTENVVLLKVRDTHSIVKRASKQANFYNR